MRRDPARYRRLNHDPGGHAVELAHGPGVPDGTYKRVCHGCALERHDTILTCKKCKDDGTNSWVSASIARSRCETFAFIDGALACDRNAGRATLPKGSYLNSCGGCRVVGEHMILFCDYCQGHNAAVPNVQLNFGECGSVGNDGGALVCEALPEAGRDGLPHGSYQSSCDNCRTEDDGATLTCEKCHHGPHSYRTSSISTRDCDAFKNMDGHLVCSHPAVGGGTEEREGIEGDEEENCDDAKGGLDGDEAATTTTATSAALPEGTFQNSCAGCRVTQDKSRSLTLLDCAFCYGHAHNGPSSIRTDNCRSKWFVNEGGHLKCGTRPGKRIVMPARKSQEL